MIISDQTEVTIYFPLFQLKSMSNRNHLEISISEIIQYTGEIDIFRLDLAMYNFEGVY